MHRLIIAGGALAGSTSLADQGRFRTRMVAGLIVAGLASLGAWPADAAPKKTPLECSDDYVECVEYCDKREKPIHGPNHKQCIAACQYTYNLCDAPDPAFDSHVFVPGGSAGVYDTGSGPTPRSFQYQSSAPSKAQ
jgi:hypothetical protein